MCIRDSKEAEQMLDAAGWKKGSDGIRAKDGKKMELNFPYISTKATDKDLAEYFQGELKKIGVEVKLTAMEEDDYWENAKTGNFDMMLTFSWGAPWDPHAWMTALTCLLYTSTALLLEDNDPWEERLIQQEDDLNHSQDK